MSEKHPVQSGKRRAVNGKAEKRGPLEKPQRKRKLSEAKAKPSEAVYRRPRVTAGETAKLRIATRTGKTVQVTAAMLQTRRSPESRRRERRSRPSQRR